MRRDVTRWQRDRKGQQSEEDTWHAEEKMQKQERWSEAQRPEAEARALPPYQCCLKRRLVGFKPARNCCLDQRWRRLMLLPGLPESGIPPSPPTKHTTLPPAQQPQHLPTMHTSLQPAAGSTPLPPSHLPPASPSMAEPRRKTVGRELGSRLTQIPASATQSGAGKSECKAERSRPTSAGNASWRPRRRAARELGFQHSSCET